jgi:hypothetical protein
MERRHLTAVGIIIMLILGFGTLVILFLNNQAPEPTLTLTKISQIDTGGRTADVKVVGDVAYVIDQNEPIPGGLVLVNISDPSNPSELASLHDGGLPNKVDVMGNYVFVADIFEGLEIINASDPTNPNEIAEYTGSGEVFDVQIVENIAYVADWNNGLIILNVSDPGNPELLASYPITGACHQLHVVNDLAFVVDHRSENTGVKVLNVSNPENPFLVGSYMPGDEDLWNPFVYGDYMYTGNHGEGGGELQILDVSDPSDISQIAVYNPAGNVFAVYVEGSIAYLADYGLGLVLVDVSDPENPVRIGGFYDGGGAINLDVIGDLVYVADRSGGLEIIQVSEST